MSRRSLHPTPIIDKEVADFLMAFALRFDGYRYAASRGRQDLLAEWSDQFVATLQLATDPNENHAVFFALQRFLGKWGGEMLSDESREHLAYRLLFLHLYHAAVDPSFTLDWGTTAMDEIDLTRLEAVAARIRAQLIARTLQHGDPINPNARPHPQP